MSDIDDEVLTMFTAYLAAREYPNPEDINPEGIAAKVPELRDLWKEATGGDEGFGHARVMVEFMEDALCNLSSVDPERSPIEWLRRIALDVAQARLGPFGGEDEGDDS